MYHCMDCRFWEELIGKNVGYCVRYPPSAVAQRGIDGHGWPITECTAFCGESKLKANTKAKTVRFHKGE